MRFCENVNEPIVLCSLSLIIIQFLHSFELEVNSKKPMMLLEFDNNSRPNVIFLPPIAINSSCQNELCEDV